MMGADLDFRRLRQRVSVERFLEHRGLLDGLRLRGDQLVGPCPVHGGDNRSAFVVDCRRNLWHCFTGCGGGGDVIELVRRLDGVGYRQAALCLANLADQRPLGPSPLRTGPSGRPFQPYRNPLRLDPLHPFLRDKGIGPETASRFEVGAWWGAGMLEGCIAVRLRDHLGRPLGYAGRRLSPGTRGKWVFPPGLPKSQLLYQYHRLPEPPLNLLVVVEGPWGVLRLAQLGIPAVALFGVHLSGRQAELLRSVPRLLVMLDGDPAGRSATERICRLPEASPVRLGDGLDPDDLSDLRLSEIVMQGLPS
jgi:DNA primase